MCASMVGRAVGFVYVGWLVVVEAVVVVVVVGLAVVFVVLTILTRLILVVGARFAGFVVVLGLCVVDLVVE